jgi:hypothetical protein
MKPVLTVEEVQEHIKDRAENNHLLDAAEFTPTSIVLAMDLAISAYNLLSPVSSASIENFPYKSLLMTGTLWKLYSGQLALKARNFMNYSDGGLQVPVEEQFQLYQSLAAIYQEEFMKDARQLKTHGNLESGWGSVGSDYGNFPDW